VSVTEAGQLMLDLNGSIAATASTVAGRATGTSQISNSVIINAVANDVLRVINPTGNATALTITPSAGGTHAVSAWLTIKRVG
jgi:microcompartment protein CcmL/EutN